MKRTDLKTASLWPLLAISFLMILPSCERNDELARLRAENEALKGGNSPIGQTRNRESERAILTALRKMSAAVDTGINFRSYGDLLIQAVVEIEPRLPEIPDGPFKENAAASLLAFKDARDFWSKFTGRSRSATFTDEEKAQYARYKLYWLNDREETVDSGKYVNAPASDANLSVMWQEGNRRLKLAEAAAK